MHEFELIFTLASGLGVALVFGYFTHRLGLSPIVGYLLAGVAVGPNTPGFVADAALAEQLAEVGVILLMFGVGLQFHLDELLAVRRIAIPGAIAQSAVATGFGAVAAHLFGFSWTAAIVFGLALSVASTVVLVRVLSDNRELHTSAGHIAVGWLVVEDIFTVVVLVVLPTLFTGNATPERLAAGLGIALLKMAGLVAVAAVGGTRLIPLLLDRIAETRSRELFTLTVLALALGIAAGAAVVFGVSMALGAFVAGMVVGRSEYSLRAATEALPMRDAFAVLFFVSVGMLLNPGDLLAAPGLMIAALAIVVVGKPAVAAIVMMLMRYPARTVFTVAMALGQIGEFSFILTVLARDLGIVPDVAMDAIVAVAIVSIVLNPMAWRLSGAAERLLARVTGAMRLAVGVDEGGRGAASSLDPSDRAVVIGYGPTGRTAARLLRDNGIAPTIVELNMDTVRTLRQEGWSAIYGDARDPDTLISAGVRHANTFIVSGADANGPEIIRAARELNRGLHIFARGAYLRDVAKLRSAGAEEVFSGEGEVALALTEAVLRRMGATPDQIDRERQRLHGELHTR